MVALVWAVGQFRPYLLGRPFTVRTDHSAVQWLYSFKESEGQVARWLESLAEYEFTVQHRPGKRLTIMLMLCLAYRARMPPVNANRPAKTSSIIIYCRTVKEHLTRLLRGYK